MFVCFFCVRFFSILDRNFARKSTTPRRRIRRRISSSSYEQDDIDIFEVDDTPPPTPPPQSSRSIFEGFPSSTSTTTTAAASLPPQPSRHILHRIQPSTSNATQASTSSAAATVNNSISQHHQPSTSNVTQASTSSAAANSSNASQQPSATVPTSASTAQSCDEHKLVTALSYAYASLVKLNNRESLLNNMRPDEVFTSRHTRIMNAISRHFMELSVSRILDFEIRDYVETIDVTNLSYIDRVRVFAAKLEIERNRHQVQQQRQSRLRSTLQHHAACPVCLEDVTPTMDPIYPDCGHVYCFKCLNEILDNRTTQNCCPNCRRFVLHRDDVNHVSFRFNAQNDPICRFCEAPFVDNPTDNDACYILNCGHAYHKRCLHFNRHNCIGCNVYTVGQPKKFFLHFR